MITAPYMTSYHSKIRQEYLDEDCEMYSFALGALDAPEVIAAGSHYWYKGFSHSFVMPSAVSRND